MKAWSKELQQTVILAFPMVLNQVSQHLIQVIDAAMIGRVGVVELAASAFASNIFTVPLVFCYGLTIAVSILVSSAHGEGDRKKANHALRAGLLVSSGVSAVLVGCFMMGAGVLDFLGQTKEVVAEARPYYLLLLGSLVPAVVFSCFKNYSEAMSRPWIPLAVTVGMLLANVFFNWVFIFGKWGAPELGLVGAGIGTLIARVLATLVLLAAVSLGKETRFRILTQDWFHVSGREIKDYLALGIPSGLQIIFEVTAFVTAAIMMGWIGEATLAAHQISINVAAMTFMVVLGISFATSIRVGQHFGKNDAVGLRRAGIVGLMTNVVFMSSCMVGLILFRDIIPGWFVNESTVIEIASGLLIVAAFFQVFDGIQISMMSALRGMRDVKVPTFIVMFVYYGVCLPLAWLLAFKLGFRGQGIWCGLAIGLCLSAIALTIRFHLKSKRLIVGANDS